MTKNKRSKKQYITDELSVLHDDVKFPMDSDNPKWAKKEWDSIQEERRGYAIFRNYANYSHRPGSKRMFRTDMRKFRF